MKAFTTLGDGIEALKLSELPVPEIKAGEILVKMRAASLNYRDLLVVKGVENWKPLSRRIPISDGVSLFATQFVHALGGQPIITSSSDEKLEKAKELGAIATINYKRVPNWDEHIIELTNGKGVDHVIEVVGGEHLNRSLNVVKLSGTICFIGLIEGLRAPINTYQFVTKNVRIHGIETGSREMFEEMNQFIDLHQLKPVIDKVFGYNETREALKHLEDGTHFGKIVVEYQA